MPIWIIAGIFVGIALVILNVIATDTVLKSTIHGESSKRNHILMIWLIPIFGVILSMKLISKDLKEKASHSDEEIATALKDFADKINTLEANIQRKKDGRKKLH